MPRFELLKQWLEQVLQSNNFKIEIASSDASFRQYYRVTQSDKTYIVMDAPPSREDVKPFIRVTNLLEQTGINVPTLYAEDIVNGFLLLGDLGSQDYLQALNNNSADHLYADAIDTIVTLQLNICSNVDLPLYDRKLLMQEMALFQEWFLEQHLAINLSAEDKESLQQAFSLLANSALSQPQAFVHRDYHSRNLMVCSNNNPGVIDYQDAVWGPVSYDLVSLLRDCYIQWPEATLYRWLNNYYQQAHDKGLLECEEQRFIEWFDLMGMQRHLKAIGIFSRLNHRDNKPEYMKDIPRTLGYILSILRKYPQFLPLSRLFEKYNISVDCLSQAHKCAQ